MAEFIPKNATIALLEERIQRDEGNRGIKDICLQGELENAATKVVAANRIAIITGFPCMLDYSPPTETDGPLGALAIARCCLAIGKSVIILTDECNEEAMLACAAASDLYSDRCDESDRPLFSMESFPGSPSFDEKDAERLLDIVESIDLVVAIERAGPSHDGTYRTMRKRDMSHLIAPLDRILPSTSRQEGFTKGPFDDLIHSCNSHVCSIGIGDGGNEVGMGKQFEKILTSTIPNASDIACVVGSDDLIVASVSNWGGYALAAAVAVLTSTATTSSSSVDTAASEEEVEESQSLQKSPIFMSRAAAVQACLVTDAEEVIMCERLVAAGARDGVTGTQQCWVDGMPLQASIEVLQQLRNIVLFH